MTTAQEIVVGLAIGVPVWFVIGYLWTHGVSLRRGLSILAGIASWMILWCWWMVTR